MPLNRNSLFITTEIIAKRLPKLSPDFYNFSLIQNIISLYNNNFSYNTNNSIFYF